MCFVRCSVLIILLVVSFGVGVYVGYSVQSSVCGYLLEEINTAASAEIASARRSQRAAPEL